MSEVFEEVLKIIADVPIYPDLESRLEELQAQITDPEELEWFGDI